jgi:hypothetical protein
VSPVKYELGFYIPDDGILHSHCRENLKSYTVWVFSVMLHKKEWVSDTSWTQTHARSAVSITFPTRRFTFEVKFGLTVR